MANVNDMDQIVEMSRKAVADIIASVNSVGDLLKDENRMSLITAIGDRMNQLGANVNDVMGDKLAQAYFQGFTDADSFLQSDGMDTTVNGVNKQIHLAGVQSIVADTMQDMNASYRTATMMGIDDIDAILSGVRDEIGKGMILGDPSGVVASRVENSFAESGMTAFITSDGKRLPLDFYAQTVTRTKFRTAHTSGAVNRYMESGVYHVQINEHYPTCDVCAEFQGMVVALDEEHAQGFPVAEIDVPLPPYHPNCQHVVRPYVMDFHSQNDIDQEQKKWDNHEPGEDKRTDAQKELYKADQDIRRTVRQEMKEYDLMKATLSLADIPKTLGAFRRMKRKNDSKWIALQTKYKTTAGIVAGNGPGPGSPRKRRGSRNGSSSGTAPPPRKKTATKPTVGKTTKTTNITTKATVMKLTKNDQNAQKAFDKRVDNIEFNDRRKTAKHIIGNMPGGSHVKIGIRNKIGANGYVSFNRTPDMKLHVTDFVLLKDDPRPEPYRWKTMFHEYFHLNAQGLDYPPGGLGREWTKWEETATETSAFFMAKRSGVDTSRILPSYSDHLTETLPRLKQLPEFKDAVTLSDFGAIFMKYRFDDATKTADWNPLRTQAMAQKGISDMNKYFADNYREHVMKNIDKYETMIFESLTQDNKAMQESGIRSMVRKGLAEGIKDGKVTREIRMILPVLFNEYGVITP